MPSMYALHAFHEHAYTHQERMQVLKVCASSDFVVAEQGHTYTREHRDFQPRHTGVARDRMDHRRRIPPYRLVGCIPVYSNARSILCLFPFIAQRLGFSLRVYLGAFSNIFRDVAHSDNN